MAIAEAAAMTAVGSMLTSRLATVGGHLTRAETHWTKVQFPQESGTLIVERDGCSRMDIARTVTMATDS